MKFNLLLLLPLGLVGCVKVDIQPLKYNEVFGVNGYQYENRIFSAKCSGNGRFAETSLTNTCVKNMAQIAAQNGFDYFTVLSQNSSESTTSTSFTTYTPTSSFSTFNVNGAYGSGFSYGTTPVTNVVPVQTHKSEYIFVLIDEQEIPYCDNFYSVSDYLK